MTIRTSLRMLPATLAMALASLALNATAQNPSPTGPGATPGNQAGEACEDHQRHHARLHQLEIVLPAGGSSRGERGLGRGEQQ